MLRGVKRGSGVVMHTQAGNSVSQTHTTAAESLSCL